MKRARRFDYHEVTPDTTYIIDSKINSFFKFTTASYKNKHREHAHQWTPKSKAAWLVHRRIVGKEGVHRTAVTLKRKKTWWRVRRCQIAVRSWAAILDRKGLRRVEMKIWIYVKFLCRISKILSCTRFHCAVASGSGLASLFLWKRVLTIKCGCVHCWALFLVLYFIDNSPDRDH